MGGLGCLGAPVATTLTKTFLWWLFCDDTMEKLHIPYYGDNFQLRLLNLTDIHLSTSSDSDSLLQNFFDFSIDLHSMFLIITSNHIVIFQGFCQTN